MKGLSFPVMANKSGGIKTVEGDENDFKIITLAMLNGDNENAFMQDISLSGDIVFEISDPLTRPRLTTRLVRIFEKFQEEKRFKLLKNTISWDDSESGNLKLSFRYLNLESDDEKTYEHKFNVQ